MVDAMADDDAGEMVGPCGDKVCRVPLDPKLCRLAGVLSPLPE